MNPPDRQDCDVAVVGGGLVGASLALALAKCGWRVTVVEPKAHDAEDQQSFDDRSVALTWSSRLIFESLGIWQQIENRQAEPIVDIHVSDRGHFGMTRLSREDVGTEALGYVVPTRVLGQVLHEQMLSTGNISLLCPAAALEATAGEESATLTVAAGGDPFEIAAKLLVMADGGRSGLLEKLGLSMTPRAFSQSALLTIVSTDRDHGGRAYERFTGEGPLALLPYSEKRYAVVWTSEPESLAERLALDDSDFIDQLQRAFGHRAGRFHSPTARKSYPLSSGSIDSPVGLRTLVIGNAAHVVHPVAGQGFNLGLRDVAAAADLLVEAAGVHGDPGNASTLASYAARRKGETWRVGRFTDGLIAAFSSGSAPLAAARSLALFSINVCPPMRRFLLRRTMGLANPPALPASD